MMEAKGKEIKHVLKILLLGDGAVGKTSLILRFIENKFKEEYSVSLGVDFLTKKIHFIDEDGTTRSVSLQVWDIAGQARHVSYSHLYLKGALGALYVFDLTRKETLDQIQNRWQIQALKASPKHIGILIGNKADLKRNRAISKSHLSQIAASMHVIDLIETSAKTGENVNEAFQRLTTEILNVKAKKFL
ncbi:MAG: Rab family GTPase [Candidatus Hodarchaeales archaeon]|jgi:small GTP-binding protein